MVANATLVYLISVFLSALDSRTFQTALCRSRLANRPQAGRSVHFYSQLPNGQKDSSSLHGACPVLNGTKVSICYLCYKSSYVHVLTNLAPFDRCTLFIVRC